MGESDAGNDEFGADVSISRGFSASIIVHLFNYYTFMPYYYFLFLFKLIFMFVILYRFFLFKKKTIRGLVLMEEL
jgi:hypothetical protein